ncbi:glycoside hydrolase domain-containing protein [Streptomyces sp. CA-135486]|uniref:glycoside hydrolase domain-containing protein n=1 Tax=Streptomyces sp. CA-135486 TaxID=3240049 RepID=UPI003D8A8EAD
MWPAGQHGIGAGTYIYFGVDYEARDEEIGTNVVPYFKGGPTEPPSSSRVSALLPAVIGPRRRRLTGVSLVRRLRSEPFVAGYETPPR